MRGGIEPGFNIVYGIAEGVERAVNNLADNIRAAQELYDVDFVGGLTVKEDAKNRFHAVWGIMCNEKKPADEIAVAAVDTALKATGAKKKQIARQVTTS